MVKNSGFLGHFLLFFAFFQFLLNISASSCQNLILHEIFDLLTALTPLEARPQCLKRKLSASDTVIGLPPFSRHVPSNPDLEGFFRGSNGIFPTDENFQNLNGEHHSDAY